MIRGRSRKWDWNWPLLGGGECYRNCPSWPSSLPCVCLNKIYNIPFSKHLLSPLHPSQKRHLRMDVAVQWDDQRVGWGIEHLCCKRNTKECFLTSITRIRKGRGALSKFDGSFFHQVNSLELVNFTQFIKLLLKSNNICILFGKPFAKCYLIFINLICEISFYIFGQILG